MSHISTSREFSNQANDFNQNPKYEVEVWDVNHSSDMKNEENSRWDVEMWDDNTTSALWKETVIKDAGYCGVTSCSSESPKGFQLDFDSRVLSTEKGVTSRVSDHQNSHENSSLLNISVATNDTTNVITTMDHSGETDSFLNNTENAALMHIREIRNMIQMEHERIMKLEEENGKNMNGVGK